MKVVHEGTLDELTTGIEAGLSEECRAQLCQFGVHGQRAALTDFPT